MERVQGRDIFHSGDIFCKTHKKNGRVAKVNAQGWQINFKAKISQGKTNRFAHGERLLITYLTRGDNYKIHHLGYAYIILTCYLG